MASRNSVGKKMSKIVKIDDNIKRVDDNKRID